MKLTDLPAALEEFPVSPRKFPTSQYHTRPSDCSTLTTNIRQETSSGTATPWEDQVPQFSHECVSLPDQTNPASTQNFKKVKPAHSPFKETSQFRQELYDPNDPHFEEFPSDRVSILAKLRETQRYMAEDETNVDTIPPSPVVGANLPAERLDLPSPSPNMLARSDERSLSLDSIPEGDDYLEEVLANIPNTGDKSIDGEAFEGIGIGERNLERKMSVDVHEVAPESPHIVQENAEAEEKVTPGSIELPPRILGDGEELNGPRQITPETGPSIVVSPATPGLSVKHTNSPVDIAKIAAIEEENGRTQLKSRKSTDVASTSTDIGKSTATESGITPRTQVSPTSERTLTPTSIRSMPKEANSKNFLTNFFKILFVDWIGGFFVKLFGGHRNA
jgi:hypothetical protein